MDKANNIIDIFLDGLKKTLVRFKNAKFGLLFIIDIFKIPDFITDNKVNIINKLKVVFSIGVAILYFVTGIDLIPEMLTGFFGLFDDLFVLLWSLGIVSEEIQKYKKMIKESKDSNVIEDVDFEIKDDK
ncbi:MAG: YkvA family protein [Peptostreptococcaceae bacterium]